jgi:dTDP-4-amino-4,6-dideoxygalactose transaminase
VNGEHSYQSYACLYQPEAIVPTAIARINGLRNAWMDRLMQAGISTRPATHAVHMLSFYRNKYGLSPESFPRAHAANDCSVSLPLFHGMTVAEQSFVIECVLESKPQ